MLQEELPCCVPSPERAFFFLQLFRCTSVGYIMWFANISSCNLLRITYGATKLPQNLLENLPSVTGHQQEVEGQKCKT